MALPVTFADLDTSHDGLPYGVWANAALTDLASLDTSEDGLPFYAPVAATTLVATANTVTLTAPTATIVVTSVLAAGSNTVTLSAPALHIHTMYRIFPLVREERVVFSHDGTHVIPAFDYQDPALIP